ncbi:MULTISPECIES: YsnF/AvaK domain-containing protein [Hymenobacter]|uniref:Conserved domain-containing protein n=1 Tax=Hymenobacter mucosus TaxID=1411120 RepID=A0A238W804_9BACT|nr:MULTISPECIES: YsnF/AvaK domain-containing protein [Hymenobacter]SNR42323.1 conserved domain-containing protein [Hymenobacter mucosus]
MDTSTNSSFPSQNPPRVPATSEERLVIPIIEEHAVVSREVVESGRVRLAKTVHEREEHLEIPLQHEEILVERVAINQFVADGAPTPGTRYEDNVTIIPVLREVVVTRLLVVEEIRVLKRVVQTTHTEPVTLRHEELHVERQPAAASAATPLSPNTPSTNS